MKRKSNRRNRFNEDKKNMSLGDIDIYLIFDMSGFAGRGD